MYMYMYMYTYIQGSNSVDVHIQHLEAGVYQFQLTVTDTAGQTDTAFVTIDVQTGKNNTIL